MTSISFEHDIFNKKIVLSPYTTDQEKSILLNKEMNEKFSIDGVLRLLKSNINTEEVFDLRDDVKKYILLKLREHSVGEIIPVTVKCTSCNKKFESSVDIQKLKINTNALLKIDDRVFESYNLKLINEPLSYENMHLFLDIDEEFTDDLSTNTQEVLKNFIKSNIELIDFNFECKCTFCKAKNNINISGDQFIISSMSEDSLINIYKTINILVYNGHYSKSDIEQTIPFERNIYLGLVVETIEKHNQAIQNANHR